MTKFITKPTTTQVQEVLLQEHKMKIDVVKTPPFVNRWVIDERGFKKLGSQPLNKAQTAPSSCNLVADKPLNNAKMVRPGFNGQVNREKVVASPLEPSIK